MRLRQMKTIDIFQRIRLNTCLFVLIFGGTDRGWKTAQTEQSLPQPARYTLGKKDKKPVMSMKL